MGKHRSDTSKRAGSLPVVPTYGAEALVDKHLVCNQEVLWIRVPPAPQKIWWILRNVVYLLMFDKITYNGKTVFNININNCCPVENKPELVLTLLINQIQIKGKIMAIQLTDIQKVAGQVSAVDSKGFAAQLEAGSFAYASSDENVAVVQQDADDESKFVIVAGVPGSAQIQFSADADLGEGVLTLSGTVDVEVVAGQAVSLSAALGTPEAQ